MKLRIVVLMIVLISLMQIGQATELKAVILSAESVATDSYMLEKTKYANTQDWGEYEFAEANFYIVLDGEPYLLQVKDGKVKEVKAGVPGTYDYKIVTTTKVADKWWKIAEYYFEHGELTWKHKLWDIPLLKLQTPIKVNSSRGNIAFMVANVKNSARILIE